MTRSVKKTPITGITTSESEKRDKQEANRKFRRIEKRLLSFNLKRRLEEFMMLPNRVRDVSDNWLFSKDGKIYLRKPDFVLLYRRK